MQFPNVNKFSLFASRGVDFAPGEAALLSSARTLQKKTANHFEGKK